MIIEPNANATAEEIDTFRTALAVVTATYRNNRQEFNLARQLITNSEDFGCAMTAIANLLLQVIDNQETGIDGESVLTGFRAAAAIAVPTDK